MSTLMEVPATTLQGSFAGHETFAFRYRWLKKGVDGLAREPEVFGQEVG